MKPSSFSRALPLVVLSAFAAWPSSLAAKPDFFDDGGSEHRFFPHPNAPEDEDRYIVTYDTDEGHRAIRNDADEVLLELGPQKAVAVRINPKALVGLANRRGVVSVEVDPPRYAVGLIRGGGKSLASFAEDLLESTKKGAIEGDKKTSQQRRRLAQVSPYGIAMVQADQVTYDATSNKKVCIIDSGYDLGHEDLPSGVSGYNGNLAWDEDGFGHGTHVAGTIAGLDNTVGVVGVAPGVDLYIVRVFGNDGNWAYSSSLIDALNRCTTAGADIVSMSLGCSGKRCSSNSERAAFDGAYANGVLSIAAAGNDGNTQSSYPASYDSVVSVAALDSSATIASFSQQNSQVELAAPGVTVRSTVPMGAGSEESAAVAGVPYEVTAMEGSPSGTGSGNLFRCNTIDGLGSPGDCAGASGEVCLIQRGAISFAEKVQECEAQGGVGAIIFNNPEHSGTSGLFSGTLGGAATGIQSVGMSQADGEALEASMTGSAATVTTMSGNYAFYDGTSMATPHVSGVAALVWSHHPDCSAADIRQALGDTALDLGSAGRDNAYGHGLVQAQAAVDHLTANGCGGGGGGGGCTLAQLTEPCSAGEDCCSGACSGGKPGTRTCIPA